MKKLLKITLPLVFLMLIVSCNFNTPKPPVSYVDGTWKGVFEGYWTGMNNNYVFWNLDSPSDEWDVIYNQNIGKFEKLGKVDYTDAATTKEAIMLLFDVAKNLSDSHYALVVPTDKAQAVFLPRDYQIAKKTFNGTEQELLEIFYDMKDRGGTNPEADAAFEKYKELLDKDSAETTVSILKNTFEVKWPDVLPDTGNFAYWSSDDINDILPASLKGDKNHYTTTLPDDSGTALNDYFKEWMLFGTYLDKKVSFCCLLGLTKGGTVDGTSLPEDCIYLGFSNFEFYTYVNNGDADLLALLDIFHKYKQQENVTGLILDVRGNSGGYNIDRYLLFSELVKEPHKFARSRPKIGDNRLDFGPWIPVDLHPYKPDEDEPDYKPAVLYNKPIVAVTNKYSISNAEMTALLAKSFPKGTSIGNTTYGAEGTLMGDNTNTTANAGEFSVGSYISTVYTPYSQTSALDGTIYEGKGVPPTTPVSFDKTEFESGTDARLNAAFQYVIVNK